MTTTTLNNSANLGHGERITRQCIRNAYLFESVDTIRTEAAYRGSLGKWFEAACLLELATEE